MSGFIDQLRAQLGDPRSPRDLTLILGDQLTQTGRKDVFDANPDFAQEYAQLKDEIERVNRPSYTKEFTGAFGSAVDSAQAGGLGLLKLGADVIGADQVGDYLGRQVDEQNRQAAEFRPSVPSYENIHNADDAARYALYGAGTVAPSMAIGAAGGALGGLAGRALLGAGGAVAGETAAAAAARAAANVAAIKTGTEIGIGASSVGQEVGSIYNDTGAVGPSLGYGIAAGLLDALPEAYVVGKFFPQKSEIGPAAAKAAVGYWKRFAIEAAKVVPMEATTEAAQTLLELAAAKHARGEAPDSFTPADYRQALNAGAIGAIGGLAMSPVAAISSHDQPATRPPAPPPISTEGLPPDVASAVRTAEAVAQSVNPQPAPDYAVSIQSTDALPVGQAPSGGQGIRGGDQINQESSGARQPGPQATQAPAELKPIDPTWRITVQSAQGDIPGYVQIDQIGADGDSKVSASPEALRAQGYEVPDFSHLPQGQYTAADAMKQPTAPAAESRVPTPTAADVMPTRKIYEHPATPAGSPGSIGPEGQPIDESPAGLPYDEFKKQYQTAFEQSQKYTADQIGSRTYTDEMARLADENPSHLTRFEQEIEAQANGLPPPPPPAADEQLVVPSDRTTRDMVRMSSRVRAIDQELLGAYGEKKKTLLLERLQVQAEMGSDAAKRAIEQWHAEDGQPDADAIVRKVVRRYGITTDPTHKFAGEIKILREEGAPKAVFRRDGANPDQLGEGIQEALVGAGLSTDEQAMFGNEGDVLDRVRQAFGTEENKFPPQIETPLVKKAPEVFFTKRLQPGGDPFYSRVIRTVETSQQQKATGEQWKNTIRNSKIGVSRDEMNLMRVDDLESGHTYSKQEVLDHLRANEVQVQEVTLGEPGPRRTGYEIWRDEQAPFVAEAQRKGIAATDTSEAFYNQLPEQYRSRYERRTNSLDGVPDRTHFESYQLPGANDGSYREVLLTVPPHENVGAAVDDGAGGLVQATKGGRNWKDGHQQYAGITNPIVRLRYNERTTADGKRMLFLEEVQPPQKGEFDKMPEAFQKNWREIAFKWALRKASAEGYDSLGWTTGEHQAERYSLEKQVKAIEWFTEKEGTDYHQRGVRQFVVIDPVGDRNIRLNIDGAGKVIDDLNSHGFEGQPLDAIIGKEVAAKILASPEGELSGEGLKIGGEGLKKLYDSDFRNVVNNLPAVKKAGQKVATETISTAGRSGEMTAAARDLPPITEYRVAIVRDDAHRDSWNVEGFDDGHWEKTDGPFDSWQEAEAVASRARKEMSRADEVHSLTITPAIRDAATQGMAVLTRRTSSDSLTPNVSAARLLESTVKALVQDRGIPVAPLSAALAQAGDSAIKTAGITTTTAQGQKLVAYALDSVHGPMAPQSIIALLHEAGHVFTDGLDERLRIAFQDAIDELPWSAQRWLNNPEALDARLIATADPETLSPLQREALAQMTAEEIAAARALPADTLAQERMAEHLAQLGWDKKEATTLIDRLFRFIKDLWLQTAMAIQTVLKGAEHTDPKLAQQFVENRFLQFIDRDAAYTRDRINDLRNWVGIPQTTRERQPNFPGGADAEMRMQFADPATGTLIPISYGTYTPDSMRAYVQRSLDNAARAVREQRPGQTAAQVEFTKRVNFQRPMPLEPSATVNVKLASLNLEEEIYQSIREDRNVAGLLPREKGQPIDHATFLADWMKLPEQQHPMTMKGELVAAAAQDIDPTTGKPVEHNPEVRINELPGVDIELTGKEKEKAQVHLSQQQDGALEQTIFSLRDTQRRLQRTLTRESERLNDLIGQRQAQKNEFPKEAATELDELQRTTLLRAELVKLLLPQIAALESKFDPRQSVAIYPTGEYPRVPSPTADADEILAARRGVVPRDLNFSSDRTKAELGADLAAMEEWLNNPDNRKKGAIYGTVDEAYRKLMQIPTDLKRVHTAVLLRRSITNGLAEELRLTGIPSLVAFGKKLINVAKIVNENRVEAHNLGVKWEVAFAAFAKSLGVDAGQTFRDTWWDPLNRIWDRVDVSRLTQLTSPDQWRTPIDQVVKALNQVTGLEVRTDAQRTALRDLMLATTDNNRHFMSVEIQNDVKVHDDKLGFERRLVPRGIVGGRRTFARHLMGLFARMNPEWSDTKPAVDGQTFWDAAFDLYRDDRGVFDENIKRLFPSYVIQDFVEPWVHDNDPVFPAPASDEDSAPRMAAPSRVRRAWREADGDVTRFAEILHSLEGGEPDNEATTVAAVLRTLRSKFEEQKAATDQQFGRQQIGSEILPRQLMDARVAHNWPAEHVSYATYTPIDNSMVLAQLALGASLGRDALGERSEMHMTLAEAKRDLAELWARHEELVAQGRTMKEIDTIMGPDDARIARNKYALTENIDNIEKAIVGMTMNSGYLMNDFKAMNAAVGFFASMMIQNPRSGFGNIISDVQGPLRALKFSSQGLRAFWDSASSTTKDMATAVVRAFGIDAKFNANLAHELYVNGAVEPEAAVTWRQKQHFGAGTSLTKPVGTETLGAKIARNITRASSRGREIAPNVGSPFQVPFREGDEEAAVAPKLRAGFFGTTAMSTQFANNRAGYNLFAQLANRGVAYIESLPTADRAAFVRELELGTRDLDSRQLGYNRGLILNDEAAFSYLKNTIQTQFTGSQSSVGRWAAAAFRRKEAAGGGNWQILANSQFSDIINVTNSYWTLQNNFATIPPWMNGPLKPLFIFLTWPYQAMHAFGNTFTDPRGRLTFRGYNSTVADGLKTFFLLAAPATIAGSFAIDLYDKYGLGKKQNLREASLATALPGIGAFMDPHAFMERIGRYGSAGFATDLLNRIVNYDTQRNLSLDDRIVAISSIENLVNTVAVEPFQTGGNLTYASTVRPFLQAIGGGGVLQYLQVANNLLGLNNQEAAINARINTGNYLRAAGRELEMPVRVMSGPMEAPTPVSPYMHQMEIAAIIDNPELFRAAYQNAVEAARQQGHDDAEKYVAQNFADRHPLRRIFRTTPTDTEYRRMLGVMGDLGSQQVRDAVNSYNRYLGTYFSRQPFYGRVEKDGLSVEQLIRQASRLSPDLNYSFAQP